MWSESYRGESEKHLGNLCRSRGSEAAPGLWSKRIKLSASRGCEVPLAANVFERVSEVRPCDRHPYKGKKEGCRHRAPRNPPGIEHGAHSFKDVSAREYLREDLKDRGERRDGIEDSDERLYEKWYDPRERLSSLAVA